MYAAYCMKSLEQVRSKCNMHSNTFARLKWIQMQWRVGSKVLCWYLVACVCTFQSFRCAYVKLVSGKLHPLQPPARRPVTLRVSLKRYSRFMPQGLGEHSLHFRTINLQLFPVTVLPMLEGSLETVVPGFECGYLLKHWQTLARGWTRSSKRLQQVEGRQNKTKRNKRVCDELGLWCVPAELDRKRDFSKGTQTILWNQMKPHTRIQTQWNGVKRAHPCSCMYCNHIQTHSHTSLMLMSLQSGNLWLSIQAAHHTTCGFIMQVLSSATPDFSLLPVRYPVQKQVFTYFYWG